jgi:hypothetical protein
MDNTYHRHAVAPAFLQISKWNRLAVIRATALAGGSFDPRTWKWRGALPRDCSQTRQMISQPASTDTQAA